MGVKSSLPAIRNSTVRMVAKRAALTAECFTPRLRYSGCLHRISARGGVCGGPVPMIATALLAWSGFGQVIVLYISGCAIVSVVATAALPSSRDRDFARDHL
jgi:hypothetical protein